MSSQCFLVGYGAGKSFSQCSTDVQQVLTNVDSVVFRWPGDPIFDELRRKRGNVFSAGDVYRELGAGRDAYREMTRRITDILASGQSVAWVTPGHPLVFELASHELVQYCRERSISVDVLGGPSFIEQVAEYLGRDIGAGTQIVSGSIFRDPALVSALSPNLALMAASIRPAAMTPSSSRSSTELDLFFRHVKLRYPANHTVRCITSHDGATFVHELTAETIDSIGRKGEMSRTTYFIPPVGDLVQSATTDPAHHQAPEDFTYQQVSPSDIDQLIKIMTIHECIPLEFEADYRPSEDAIPRRIDEILRAARDHLLDLEIALSGEDELAGFYWAEIDPSGNSPGLQIKSIWVAPKWRRRGIARALQARGEAWAAKRGATWARASVHVANSTMLRVIARHGFAQRYLELVKRFESST